MGRLPWKRDRACRGREIKKKKKNQLAGAFIEQEGLVKRVLWRENEGNQNRTKIIPNCKYCALGGKGQEKGKVKRTSGNRIESLRFKTNHAAGKGLRFA